ARQARYADKLSAGLDDLVPPNPNAREIAFDEALAQRRGFDEGVNWNPDAGGNPQSLASAIREALVDPAYEKVDRVAANELRGGIKSALDQGVDAGNVPAPLRDAWKGANDDYALGKQVLEAPKPETPGGLMGAARAAIGPGAGAAAGFAAGGPV